MSSDHRPISQQISWNFNLNGNQIIGNVNQASTQPTHPYQRQPPFPPLELVGQVFHHNVKRAVKWLQDPMSSIIGVWGMGGVGKTTLLKVIFNELKEYPEIAGAAYWVDVTQHCNEFELQERIAKFFGVDLSCMESLDSRSAPLYSKLCSMGRVVLVLDDVWDSFEVDKVGVPLAEEGCKIIFSTRDKKVCRHMQCGDCVVPVEMLLEEDALKLFHNILGNYEKLTGEMQEIAALIAQKCHSLPLAVVTIAGSMRQAEEIHEWRNVLSELSSLDRRHVPMEEKVHRTLKFSFDRLKEEVQKSCFLNCALYLESHEMRKDEVIDLWIAEGLLDCIDNRFDQLMKGRTLFSQLESACLVQSFTHSWFGT